MTTTIKLLLIRFVFFYLVATPFFAYPYDKHPTLGFTPFESSGIDKYDASIMNSIISKSFESAGIYKTLEPSDIALRLAEQNLPPTCSDVQCAIIAGQILGTDFFGIGSIGRIGKTYTISIQIIEIRSGRTIRNVSEFYKGNKKNFEEEIIPYFARKASGINELKQKTNK